MNEQKKCKLKKINWLNKAINEQTNETERMNKSKDKLNKQQPKVTKMNEGEDKQQNE